MSRLIPFLFMLVACRALAANEPSLDELKTKALAGDVLTQLQLGAKYDSGDGVRQNLKEAFKWYEMAAKAGNPVAQNNLGDFYLRGEGVKKDYAKALQFFQDSFAQNKPPISAAAACSIGLMYDSGFGVPKNPETANAWYLKAAEGGFARAMENLGLSYAQGSGVEKDLAKALQWYEKAANLGLANAQLETGYHYYNGLGVEKDPVVAVAWYRKAAAQGDVKAMTNLGLAYRDGQGVPHNNIEAFAWLDLARFLTQTGGYNLNVKWGIRGYFDELKKNMTKVETTAGEKRTKELEAELRAQQMKN